MQPTLTLTVELDPRAEPIRGTLRAPEAEARSFDGWLGLTRALEAAISAARAQMGPDEERSGGDRY